MLTQFTNSYYFWHQLRFVFLYNNLLVALVCKTNGLNRSRKLKFNLFSTLPNFFTKTCIVWALIPINEAVHPYVWFIKSDKTVMCQLAWCSKDLNSQLLGGNLLFESQWACVMFQRFKFSIAWWQLNVWITMQDEQAEAVPTTL